MTVTEPNHSTLSAALIEMRRAARERYETGDVMGATRLYVQATAVRDALRELPPSPAAHR
jgi:hypothetical protein